MASQDAPLDHGDPYTSAYGKDYHHLKRNLSSKDLEMAEPLEKKTAPLDDVDFTSGFETQYEQEYRPLKPKITVPPRQDPKTLWYRDLKTILMISFLMAIFLFGTILLTNLVFTTNPLYVFAITAIYVILAIIMIVIEVKTIHVR